MGHNFRSASGNGGAAAFDADSQVVWFEDWYSGPFGGVDWSASQSGTGAANANKNATTFTAGDLVQDGRLGVKQLTTGTTTTGRANIYNSHLYGNWGSGELATEHIQCIRVPVLSTVDEEFITSFGMSIQQSTLATRKSGAWFEYDRLNDTNWRCTVDDNGVGTTEDSGVAVDTAWNIFRIVVAADLSSVTFYINGVSVKSITTNITVNRNMNINCGIYKSAGTTARTVLNDYITMKWDWASGRPTS